VYQKLKLSFRKESLAKKASSKNKSEVNSDLFFVYDFSQGLKGER
jgi:hypothetical protein